MESRGLERLQDGLHVYLDTSVEIDEWFFERIRQALDKELTSGEAFDMVGRVAQMMLTDEYREAWQELLNTLLFLATKSETTEIPKELSGIWGTLKARAHEEGPYAVSQFDELRRYYRQAH